ncbi:TetR/AcrR family transcriptional regulator [Streptomyces litchfieldiae]|uniref:Helix-turn-helix domain-containing protein n=1 Tax=Streptomyces litchfieldiae TaxID=3075543 RepID=A0ABU2MUX1_9ACTN|nr:helix-turn-helix domain-containing protein [Streptomyces sp. DSM 44938]MDT0345360.1 helix-turn-helix domain-containing protein [Streptomyces sp. DSM 44938]
MSRSIDAPRNARSRRTRSAILAATRALLEERGLEALTMGEVAERVGVSRRGIYLHFASRTELVTALFDYLAGEEGLHTSLRRVWESPDAVAALDEWARHLARYHPRVLAVDQAVRRVRRHDADAARHAERTIASQLAHCRRLAEWLAREGRLAAPWTVPSATDMLLGLISSDMVETLLNERGWSADEFGDRLALLLRRALVADRGDRNAPRPPAPA